MPKFKKGSPEAKAFMAKLRKMKKKSAAPKKKAAPAKKKAVKKTAPKKKAATRKASTHKDTRSHNVNVKVVSGIGSIQSDLNKKLAAAKNYLAILQGKLAYTTELYKQTRGSGHKAQLPILRKKITEARRVVAQLKKVAK